MPRGKSRTRRTPSRRPRRPSRSKSKSRRNSRRNSRRQFGSDRRKSSIDRSAATKEAIAKSVAEFRAKRAEDQKELNEYNKSIEPKPQILSNPSKVQSLIAKLQLLLKEKRPTKAQAAKIAAYAAALAAATGAGYSAGKRSKSSTRWL